MILSVKELDVPNDESRGNQNVFGLYERLWSLDVGHTILKFYTVECIEGGVDTIPLSAVHLADAHFS